MNRKSLISVGIVLVITVAAIGAVIFVHDHSQKTIPQSIINKVNFVIFYPPVTQTIRIDPATVKYDAADKLVSYIVAYDNQHITFSEQESPDSFSASPDFYTNFIAKLNGYANFDSVNGRVDLTRTTGGSAETAVMNAKGTLLFARSTGDINEDNWKLLFNVLNYVQPK